MLFFCPLVLNLPSSHCSTLQYKNSSDPSFLCPLHGSSAGIDVDSAFQYDLINVTTYLKPFYRLLFRDESDGLFKQHGANDS